MMFKNLVDMMRKRARSTREWLFVFTSCVVMGFVLLYTLIGMVLGISIWSTVALLVGDVLILIATVLAVRHQKLQLGGAFCVVLIGFVLFPMSFFFSGGPFGGSLLWFVAMLLYIDLVLEDKTKWIFFVLSFLLTLACCYVSIFHPETLSTSASQQTLVTNSIAMIMMGSLINTIVLHGVRAFQRENRLAQDQAKEIAELNAAQNRFFSSMSHEIRTPVNTIIGLNEMIMRESDNPEILEDAENVEAASKILLQTINDILDMSKIELGQMQLSPAAYKTGEMLSDVVGMLWLRAKEKDLEFRVDVLPDLPEELFGDEIRLKQILINVLNNAIKYTNKGSVTLQVQWERLDDEQANVIYTVSDTGIGIKNENIPYLFTAFRREDRDENRYVEGTGLGLSIVKSLVDLMGGSITVNSIYTKGSTFIIEIPQTIVSVAPVGEIQAGRRRAGGKRVDYHQSFEAPKAKVLAVDDTYANLMVIRKLLRDTKVQLTTAGSAREALETTQNTAFDVIFMDHLMPEMDGIECLHRIRKQSGGLSKEARVIALTANAGPELKTMYAREGFDGYLPKPVNGKQLEFELQHALPSELVRVIGEDTTAVEQSIAFISEHQKKLPIIVSTESVADLPDSLVKQLNIAVIPHSVSTPEGEFRDGIEMSTRGLLSYMKEGNAVRVREPAAEEYEAFFADLLLRAHNIIHVSITEKVVHSGTKGAMKASRSFENIFVVDSGHLSSGQGLMVMEACRLAEEGKSVPEILAALEELKTRVNTSFIVDNLDYLTRDNHISPTVSLVTNALLAHPVIGMKRGNMVVKSVYFGSREASWRSYVKSSLVTPSTIDKRTLFITHAGLSHAELEHIRELVARRVLFEHVYIKEAAPAIAANCGPGSFGLLFLRK
ncbi:MAG: DegV family protein [Coriobacteriales bacterium]|nr:DegV family protein [Coriobacteriales bacterium]